MDGDTTQDSINVQLAKALGWRVEERRFDDQNWYYVLLTPDGKAAQWEVYDGYRDTAGSEREAWQQAPDFAGSVDATLATLPKHIEIYFDFWKGKHRCDLVDPLRGVDGLQYLESGATRAEALASARLAMAQAQQEAGS